MLYYNTTYDMSGNDWKFWRDWDREYYYIEMRDRFYNKFVENQTKEKERQDRIMKPRKPRFRIAYKSPLNKDYLYDDIWRLKQNKYHKKFYNGKFYYPYKNIHLRDCGCNTHTTGKRYYGL